VVIATEFSSIRVPAATPVVTAKGYLALADRKFGYFSLHSGTLFLILGLHAALFCGLVTTLSHTGGLAAQAHLPDQLLKPVPIEIAVLPGR
jgi:hypothetical protein